MSEGADAPNVREPGAETGEALVIETLESEDAGSVVLAVRGEVDLYTAPQLRARLEEAVRAPEPRVIVDLEALDFIDSTGLGVMVSAVKQARAAGGDIILRKPGPSTRKILEIAGLTELFSIE